MAKGPIKEELKELTESQKTFCLEYIFDWNGSRAYKVAYPGVEDSTARTNASKLLTNANIKVFLEEIQKDLEKTAGISRLRVIREHEKIAFSSIAHLHDTWITRKAFEQLTQDQKDSIAEIQTQTRRIVDFTVNPADKDGTLVDIEFVKIKLYDKQKSLDSINKMLGYDAAQKIALSTDETIKSFKIVPSSSRKGDSSK